MCVCVCGSKFDVWDTVCDLYSIQSRVKKFLVGRDKMTRGNQRDRDRARAQARAAKSGKKSTGASSGAIHAKNARYVTFFLFFFPKNV